MSSFFSAWKFSMMPLWIRASRSSSPPRWGWALASVGPPWVAQRVWPMPVVAGGSCSSAMASRRFASLPARFSETTPSAVTRATPAESYPRYSSLARPSITTSRALPSTLGPTYPTTPHMPASLMARATRPAHGQAVGKNGAREPPRRQRDHPLAVRRAQPRRVGTAAPAPPAQPVGRRRHAAARPGASARPRRGRGGLPPTLAAAELLRRGDGGPAPHQHRLPRGAAGQDAVHHRGRRLGGRREVDHGPHPQGAAGALAGHAARGAHHHRRLPLPQRRARAPRDPAAQGLPRVLQPPRAAALRRRGQGRPGRGLRPGLLPPDLRHRARRARGRAPARRAHRRGAERPPGAARAARRARGPRDQRLLRLLRLRRRPHRAHPGVVHRALPAASPDRVRRPALVLPPLRRPLRRGGAGHRSGDLGEHQRAQPARERPAHPRPRHPGPRQGRGPQRPARAAAQALRQRYAAWPATRHTGRACRAESMMGVMSEEPQQPQTRTEHDSMGEVQVPAEALWGAQTARAVENFPLSGQPVPPGVIHALARLKAAAAEVNAELGVLDTERARAIAAAAGEVADGEHDDEFPVDVFQTGSGTSTNMNVNEVVARLAHLASDLEVHPNDHVNAGQSSNDTFPSALRVAATSAAVLELVPALEHLAAALGRKEAEFADVVKAGRTHLMDAVPVTLGQEFGGYRRQVELGASRVRSAAEATSELPLGGTAAGTGLNAAPGFARKVIERVSGVTGIPFH